MEVFDLYDINFNKLDKKMNRGETNNKGEYHLVTHIWIKNSNNQFLVQQRNKTTDKNPYRWACTAGAASAGDTSLQAAKRETKEELGIDIDPSKFILVKRYFIEDPKANYITDVYIVKEDILLKDIIIDTVEVRDIAYKTLDEIKQMMHEGTFWRIDKNNLRKDYLSILEKS